MISDTCQNAIRDICYYVGEYPSVYVGHIDKINAALEALTALRADLYAASNGRFPRDAAGASHVEFDR